MVEAQQAGYGDETGRDFFNEIRGRVRMPLNVTPEDGVQAVMCTLSRHVAWSGARRVFEALPKPLQQAVLDRCPRHRTDPPLRFDRTELRQRVGEHLRVSLGDAEDLTSAVITILSARLGREVSSIAAQLPRDLQSLWVARRVASPSEPHPIVNRIAFEGNKKLTDALLRPEMKLRPRGVFTAATAQQDRQRILDMYAQKGRFAARVEPKIQAFVKAMDDVRRPIAFICHAPWILISSGLVHGRALTSYHTIRDDLRNAGAHWLDQEVVLDGNWVSSRQPDDLPAFNREMIHLFAQSATRAREAA